MFHGHDASQVLHYDNGLRAFQFQHADHLQHSHDWLLQNLLEDRLYASSIVALFSSFATAMRDDG